jgi:pimeloyl-ACP methyl ester carboxylesterase
MSATVDAAGSMRHLRVLGGEAATLVRLLLAMSLRPILTRSSVRHPTAQPPVVFVHGLLGDPTNFLALRRFLARRGIRRFASFSYLPRLDYPRLAPRLLDELRAVRAESGAAQVDVVGHSLGGLLARYVVETDGERLVRRLVTLAAPYTSHRNPPPGAGHIRERRPHRAGAAANRYRAAAYAGRPGLRTPRPPVPSTRPARRWRLPHPERDRRSTQARRGGVARIADGDHRRGGSN